MSDHVLQNGSPYSLLLNGVWLKVEGVAPGTPVATERPRSELTSLDGNRYAQQATLGRRQWDWTLSMEAAPAVAAARVAVEAEDVWLFSDACPNMLAPRDCYGTVMPALDVAGVPLARFTAAQIITGRVRGGVPTRVTCWGQTGDEVAATFTYPGGAGSVTTEDVPGTTKRGSASFTPNADGTVAITIDTLAGAVSGLMLTEGPAIPTHWAAGESMPCRVSVLDPDDTLTMHHSGSWRHDYGVVLREVG